MVLNTHSSAVICACEQGRGRRLSVGSRLHSNQGTRTRLRMYSSSCNRQQTAVTIPAFRLLLHPFPVAFDLKKRGGKRLERSLSLQSGEQHAACKEVFEGRSQVARALDFLATTFPASHLHARHRRPRPDRALAAADLILARLCCVCSVCG